MTFGPPPCVCEHADREHDLSFYAPCTHPGCDCKTLIPEEES